MVFPTFYGFSQGFSLPCSPGSLPRPLEHVPHKGLLRSHRRLRLAGHPQPDLRQHAILAALQGTLVVRLVEEAAGDSPDPRELGRGTRRYHGQTQDKDGFYEYLWRDHVSAQRYHGPQKDGFNMCLWMLMIDMTDTCRYT